MPFCKKCAEAAIDALIDSDKERGMEGWYEYAITADFIDKSELAIVDARTRTEYCPRCTEPKSFGSLPAMSCFK